MESDVKKTANNTTFYGENYTLLRIVHCLCFDNCSADINLKKNLYKKTRIQSQIPFWISGEQSDTEGFLSGHFSISPVNILLPLLFFPPSAMYDLRNWGVVTWDISRALPYLTSYKCQSQRLDRHWSHSAHCRAMVSTGNNGMVSGVARRDGL